MIPPDDSSDSSQGEKPSLYAGRWIARLRGRIVGHGGTPEQALRAAQTARHKEIPEIDFMPMTQALRFSPLLDDVRAALPKDVQVYLVGGAVRDALLGRPTNDLDFATPSGGMRLAKRVADRLKAAYYPLDEARDTARVVIDQPDGMRGVLDFAAFRGQDLESDLRGRDFSVNALAVDVRSMSLFDPVGGVPDLRLKQLRACSTSTFKDDPVRILRAIRQAVAFGFKIPPKTRQWMKGAVKHLPDVSAERMRDELFRIMEGSKPSASVRALDLIGALDLILPELGPLKNFAQSAPHVHDAWLHTLSLLGHLEQMLAALSPAYDPESAADLFNGLLVMHLGRFRMHIHQHLSVQVVPGRSLRALLIFAGLYHDVGKPLADAVDEQGRRRSWGHDERGAVVAEERGRSFQLSNFEVHRLFTIIRQHMRVHYHVKRMHEQAREPTRRGIYRFFRDTGEAGVDVCLLSLADLRATYEHNLSQENWTAGLQVCRILLENWWERPNEVVAPQRFLNGDELMSAFDLQPGPRIGQLLEALREAQATGEVTTREQALAFVRQKLEVET